MWTPRSTDLLITGLVGVAGGLLGGIMSGIASRFWIWWDRTQSLKAEIRRLRLQFEHTASKSTIAASLEEMKAFMINNESTFDRVHLKQLFDLWLTDECLDSEGQHSKLMPIDCVAEIKQLKADAARLVRW